jgi:ParB family transcriptional regulator, chromosome partitioning protein
VGEAGRKEVQEVRRRLEDPRQRKRKETSRKYKIVKDETEIGSVKVWDSGRVVLDVVVHDPSEREQVLGEIKSRFGIGG